MFHRQNAEREAVSTQQLDTEREDQCAKRRMRSGSEDVLVGEVLGHEGFVLACHLLAEAVEVLHLLAVLQSVASHCWVLVSGGYCCCKFLDSSFFCRHSATTQEASQTGL